MCLTIASKAVYPALQFYRQGRERLKQMADVPAGSYLSISTRVLARVMTALLSRDKQAITIKRTIDKSAHRALQDWNLVSIGAQEYRGAVYMGGRVGKKDLARLLDVTELLVVTNMEVLALRITEEAQR